MGKPYDTAATAGYNQITSVVGSDPSGGAACDPGTAADRNVGMCPNGRTITVTLKPSFTDWRALFINVVPAHISRTVGWNTGFSGAQQTISGSWFEIQSYNENQSLVLVRNPKYWGTPAKLNKLVFQFFSDDTQLVPALQNKEIDIFNPATVSLSIKQTAAQVPNTKTATQPGLEFEHFDFNQSDPYLAKAQVREAIAHGVNRQTIIARTVGEISNAVKPLGNRMLMPNQPNFKSTNYAFSTSESANLFKELGFKKGSDGYWQPNYGPQKGHDLTFTIQTTSGNPIRSQTEQLFQAQMKTIGVKINIQNYDANTLFGTNLPGGMFQIAEFAWVSTPFVSGNQSIYCSYTDTTTCSQNYNHAANTQVDQLLKTGAEASSASLEANDYNKADSILWQNMVTLPLYQKPQYWAWSNNLKNVFPNTSNAGRDLERRELDHQRVTAGRTRGKGPADFRPAPSLNFPCIPRIRACSPTSLGVLLISIVVLFFATILVFLLVASSGNPLSLLEANPHVPHSTIVARENLLHLNDPLWQRYWIWLTNALHGNLGTTINGQEVAPQAISHLLVTLRMVLIATVIAVVIAITLGVVAAVRQGKAADHVITVTNFVLLATPVFVLGLALKEFVAIPVNQHVGSTIFYTDGEQSPTLAGPFLHPST